eukprot:5113016-Amphidinium_carterae.1
MDEATYAQKLMGSYSLAELEQHLTECLVFQSSFKFLGQKRGVSTVPILMIGHNHVGLGEKCPWGGVWQGWWFTN